MKFFYTSLLILILSGCSADAAFTDPLDNAPLRATPLHFGLQVTPDPDNNPIDPPERFSGYHVATDFEVSRDELDEDVPVKAICTGRVRYSGHAEGYGGLLIQECSLNREPVTVIYGHVKIAQLPNEGTKLIGGQEFTVLADADSYDSGYTRKHLHLGIHKGKRLDMRGYVQTEAEVADFIDPTTVLPSFAIDLPLEQGGETPYWQATLTGSTSPPSNE